MSRRDFAGRPAAAVELWNQLADQLPGAFWCSKGLSSNCPFCHAVSSPGNEKFLIRFEGGAMEGWKCFVCSRFGRGFDGVYRVAREVGFHLTNMELSSMAGVSMGFAGQMGDATMADRRSDDEEDSGPMEWPPYWVQMTDEVILAGLDYMEKERGIAEATKMVQKYQIVFSEVVEIVVQGQAYIKPFPCIVFPMASPDGEIYGWTTRRIGKPGPNEPKTYAKSGSGWKEKSLFGIREIDPRRPVAIVEGPFSALSTPNPVATGGKDIKDGQLTELAESGARVFVFALDPAVEAKSFANSMYRLRQRAPGCSVLSVKWGLHGGWDNKDPNDRGLEVMTKIIAKTVMDNMRRHEDED